MPKKILRVDLPAGLRRDTLAVREGAPLSTWGDNSEALFLASDFVRPDAASAATRFANEERVCIYSHFTNPTVTGPRSTSHRRPSEQHRHVAGITRGSTRLAVALDEVADLKTDLRRGLATL